MTIQSTQLFTMLGDKMSWLTQRQRVISQNIANSDTPDYRAKDLKALEFSTAMRAQTRNLQMSLTNKHHIISNIKDGQYKTLIERIPYETSPSENGVILEEQMLKVNDTYQQYNLSTTIFKKYTSMYKMALGRS